MEHIDYLNLIKRIELIEAKLSKLETKPNWKEICEQCHEDGGPNVKCSECTLVKK